MRNECSRFRARREASPDTRYPSSLTTEYVCIDRLSSGHGSREIDLLREVGVPLPLAGRQCGVDVVEDPPDRPGLSLLDGRRERAST